MIAGFSRIPQSLISEPFLCCHICRRIAAGYAGITDSAENMIEKLHGAVVRKLTDDLFQDTDKAADK